jgi:cellulose synthase operon protein C
MRAYAWLLIPSILCLPLTAVRADNAQEQLAAASAYFDHQKYSQAADTLQAFLTQHPTHQRVGAAAFTLGRCRVELKQYDQAIVAFQQAIGSHDASVVPLAQLGLGEAAMNAQKYALAAPALEAAVKTPLKPEQAAVVWYWLGQADYNLKKYGPAEEAYNKVVSDYEQSDFAASAVYGAGLAALRQKKTDAARKDLNDFVARYPQNPDRSEARLLLAQMDLDAGHNAEARDGLEDLLRDTANAKGSANLRAQAEDSLIRALLELGDYAAAAPRLHSALERLPAKDPQRYRAELSLGHCEYRQKHYQTAIAAYHEATLSTDSAVAAEAQYWEANALLGAGKPTAAATGFQQFAAAFPKDKLAGHALLRAGDALLAAKQNDHAAAAYQVVLNRYPDTPDATEARKGLATSMEQISDPAKLASALATVTGQEHARGVVRLARMDLIGKRYADAVQDLKVYVSQSQSGPIAAEARYLLGVAYEALGKAAPAQEALAAAVRLASTVDWAADAQTRLAWRYIAIKQPAEAEKAADAALAQQPTAAVALSARSARVQALVDQQKWEPALQGCQELLAGDPTPQTAATALYTQAWINEKRGTPAAALPLWDRLASDYPKSSFAADALLHLGDARLKAEKYDEAREKFAALLAAFPQSPLAPEAQFKMGSALFNLNRPADAAAEFDAVAAGKSSAALVQDSLYWAGVAYNKAGKKDAAQQRLSRLVRDYPQNAHVSNAKIYLAALKAGG